MKVLYLHQYFRTPEEGGAIRSFYLATALVRAGFEVELVTGSNSKTTETKIIEGVKVHYLPVYYENRMSYPARFLAFSKFMIKAYFKSLSIKNVDFSYASSTPLTIGLLATLLKKTKAIPFIFEVRDVWPEAPKQLGILKSRILLKLAKWLEKQTYRASSSIVTLSPTMKDYILKGTNKDISVISNMSDCDFLKANSFEEKEKLKAENGIAGKFVISYFGSLGVANNVSRLLDLVEKLKKESIQVFIVGLGKELPLLKKRVQERDLDAVNFLGFKSKFELKEILDYTDAAYISFAQFPILESNSPNKFFDGLAAGNLIITNTKGWLKEIVKTHQCGLYVDEKNDEDISLLKKLIGDKDRIRNYQLNARKLAERKFSKQKLTSEWINFLKDRFEKAG